MQKASRYTPTPISAVLLVNVLGFAAIAGCARQETEGELFPMQLENETVFIDSNGRIIHRGFEFATPHGVSRHLAIKDQQLFEVKWKELVPVAMLPADEIEALWSLGDGVVAVNLEDDPERPAGRPGRQLVFDLDERFTPPAGAIFVHPDAMPNKDYGAQFDDGVIIFAEDDQPFPDMGVCDRDGNVLLKPGLVVPRWARGDFVSAWKKGPGEGFGVIQLSKQKGKDVPAWSHYEEHGVFGSKVTDSGFWIALRGDGETRKAQTLVFNRDFQKVDALSFPEFMLLGCFDDGWIGCQHQIYRKTDSGELEPVFPSSYDFGLYSAGRELRLVCEDVSDANFIRQVSDGVRVFKCGRYGILTPTGEVIRKYDSSLEIEGDFHAGLARAYGEDDRGQWRGYINKEGQRVYSTYSN